MTALVDQIQAAPASMEAAAPTSVVNIKAQESEEEISMLFEGPGVTEAWVCSTRPQGIKSPPAPSHVLEPPASMARIVQPAAAPIHLASHPLGFPSQRGMVPPQRHHSQWGNH